MKGIIIRPAERRDAPAIGRGVVMALGSELPLYMAGDDPRRLPLVEQLFTDLAAADNSQYSWRNTLVAATPDGSVAGILVSYDGARLHELRRAFIAGAKRVLDSEIREEELPDETDAEEIYLDSLAVFPEFRGHGLGAALIDAAAQHHARNNADTLKNTDGGNSAPTTSPKPLGLLCDPDNPRAHALYERLGFRDVGRRYFTTHLMHHMQRG